MENILVASELACEHESPLNRSLQLANISSAKLHILHITFVPLISGREKENQRINNSVKSKIRSIIEQSPVGSDIDYRVHIENQGRVYEIVDQYARKVRADLVVVGVSDRPESTPRQIYSTTEQIIVNAHYPVLLARLSEKASYRRIFYNGYMQAAPESLLLPIACSGPDVRLTYFYEKKSPLANGFFGRIRAGRHERRHQAFRSEVLNVLERRGVSRSRASFMPVEDASIKAALIQVKKENADLLVVARPRGEKVNPAMDSELRRAIQAAPFDVLFHKGA